MTSFVAAQSLYLTLKWKGLGFWMAFDMLLEKFWCFSMKGRQGEVLLPKDKSLFFSPVLKQKGCDVLTEAWETGQEQGQVKQTGLC